MIIDKEKLQTVLVTDCGSTTTKALLFEKTEKGWTNTQRGEAPTTVEAPIADVTKGALNAFTEIEEISKRKILKENFENNPFLEKNNTNGIDLYLSTSSAGGGLQMLVAGVVKKMTTASAERAALGAGAIVLDAFSCDDGYEDFERVERIRHLKPDIFLLAGGTDAGANNQVIDFAETLLSASPKPRFGKTLKLPVVYAGNQELKEDIKNILKPISEVDFVPNILPNLGNENLIPAREAIHELFLSHVMSHSPGYDKLLSWSPVPILPTPSAVGLIVENFAKQTSQNVLCADIGGATTDIFSVFKGSEDEPIYNRTVSANLGMSYSIANVFVSAGVEEIKKWLCYEISNLEIINRLRNKMIRPTSIPQTKEDLWLEQAVCREALRLSLEHHISLAVNLGGVKRKRSIGDIFTQNSKSDLLVDMLKLDVVIGSGGVLSHAPKRLESALMMIDGFGLKGLTQITVDSIFMLPHLGVFSTVHPEASNEIFINDCLINVAHSIIPVYPKRNVKQKEILEVYIDNKKVGTVIKDKVKLLEDYANLKCRLSLKPLNSLVDIGNGQGKILEKDVELGEFGLILDGRNNNLVTNTTLQQEIYKELGIL